MMQSTNTLLLALSHSFNLIIYCLSSKTFRKSVCSGMYRSSPDPSSQGRLIENMQVFGEEMRTMRTTLLTIQQSMEKTGESNSKKDFKKKWDAHPSITRDVKNDTMPSQQRDVLPYLDLAVVAPENNISSLNVIVMNKNLCTSCVTLNR